MRWIGDELCSSQDQLPRGKMNLGVPPEEVPLEESVDALDFSVKKHSALRSGRCSKGRSHKCYDHL